MCYYSRQQLPQSGGGRIFGLYMGPKFLSVFLSFSSSLIKSYDARDFVHMNLFSLSFSVINDGETFSFFLSFCEYFSTETRNSKLFSTSLYKSKSFLQSVRRSICPSAHHVSGVGYIDTHDTILYNIFAKWNIYIGQ